MTIAVSWKLLGRCLLAYLSIISVVSAETLRHPKTLQDLLLDADPQDLARQANQRGNANRGALVFHKSTAGCVTCHQVKPRSEGGIGPALTEIQNATDVHLVNSLLRPSKEIRKGFETVTILTVDGKTLSGLIVSETKSAISLRLSTDLSNTTTIERVDIDAMRTNDQSLMPDGLVPSIGSQQDFFDLVKYVRAVTAGGQLRADQLQPTAEQLAIKDDTANLDHAGIIKKLRQRDFDAGKRIYHGYCFNCHGSDGNTPALPTARAFGKDKLKFGNDPYRMFMTLSRGNGLMAPVVHLTPKERYQVIHYVREAFMKSLNDDYFTVNNEYLESLPKGTDNGTRVDFVDRDFGPALASQLERQFSSVLTVDLGSAAISYDLHSMNQAGLWEGGFLDLTNTQHMRDRGEGTANPNGTAIDALSGWQWGHENSLDYSRDHLRPRGPMPKKWMDYLGHYLHGESDVVLQYRIDQREIFEHPACDQESGALVHQMSLMPGPQLLLAAAQPSDLVEAKATEFENQAGLRSVTLNYSSPQGSRSVTAAVTGNRIADYQWRVDAKNRLVLSIPPDDSPQQIAVYRFATSDGKQLEQFRKSLRATAGRVNDPRLLTHGGTTRWPQELKTTGQLGLEQTGYALDTITIPESTPWNTWFRTSAIDFFPDGRMVVATHGGDIWIVDGVDESLLDLRWKRFAGGLYEPFGVKVVDHSIYVTCKDRLTRLHDLNDDGEADFYESFSADNDVSVNFHAFNFDLQVDGDGYLYYAKSGHGSDSDIPGCVVRISPDGKERSIYCTGFRTPNGMGRLPDGRVTASDNQGQWTPASKISVLRQDGFYGWVATYSIPGKWEPGGGTIDLSKVVPPTSFDPPLVWMPQHLDNSSGGQLFVDDPRWGPLSGRLLHTSFGKGWMYYLMMQEVGETSQAAIVKLPYDFETGIMRAAVNPADGQVYATGLQGWNGNGRIGLKDKGIQRLRYTGKNYPMVSDCKVEADGLRIGFNFDVDKATATDPDSYLASHWNYRWSKNYGSDQYSPTTGKVGSDSIDIHSVEMNSDGRGVKLKIRDMKPVNQLHLVLKIKNATGGWFEEEVYWTINAVPQAD